MEVIKTERRQNILDRPQNRQKKVYEESRQKLTEKDERSTKRTHEETEKRLKEGERKKKEVAAWASASAMSLSDSDYSTAVVTSQSRDDDFVGLAIKQTVWDRPVQTNQVKISAEKAVHTWAEHEGRKTTMETVQSLKDLNDAAERQVALATSFKL